MSSVEQAAQAGAVADRRIQVLVLAQEGFEAKEPVVVNVNAPCQELLVKGLSGLYGEGAKNPLEYDLVVGGQIVTDLTKTVGNAGVTEHSTVVIQPKDISRGGQAA